MKRVLLFVFAVMFIISLPSTASALSIDAADSIAESFTLSVEGNIVRVEITRFINYSISKVYVNERLAQESTCSLSDSVIITNIYDHNGALCSSTSTSIDDMMPTIYTNPSQPEYDVLVVPPGFSESDGGLEGGSFPWRDVTNEPIDNAGLEHAYTTNNKPYYYLGRSTCNGVTGTLYRALVTEYIGETAYFNWPANTAISGISAYLGLIFATNVVSALVSLLVAGVGLALSYEQAIEVSTYTHDYYYQVAVNGDCVYETQRYKTYWYIENTTTGTTVYELKSFDGGFAPNNIEMVNYAIVNYT